VNEALNTSGKQYSIDKIKSIIKENNKLSGNKIADVVKADLKKFIGSEMLHDDQTLLVIKVQ
jgi:sigma-B regulation protein RsbU (phosphoserine phosphatase)